MKFRGSIMVVLGVFFKFCKTYKTFYKNIKSPEIIAPETAHPAFDKACECLGIKLVKVP